MFLPAEVNVRLCGF